MVLTRRKNANDKLKAWMDGIGKMELKPIGKKDEAIKYHTVTLGGTYRHYKNKKRYRTVDTATHTETGEYLVIYYCLDDEYGEHKMFARPKEMFEEGLNIYGEVVPRFELLSPKVKRD